LHVYPDKYLGLAEFKPWLSGLILFGLVGSVAWLLDSNPYFAAEQIGLTLILAMALPAAESALGYWIAPVAIALTTLVAWLLASTTMQTDLTMQLGGFSTAVVGFIVGLFLIRRIRTFYLLPGRMNQVALPALTILVVWLFVELGIRAVDASWPILLRFQQLAAGFLVGVLFSALKLMRSGTMGSRLRAMSVEDGLAQARSLVAAHELKPARRLLAELAQQHPESQELIEMRYSVWKFDPTDQQFHEAAALLLNRGGVDADTHNYVERFYKDYLAVTQGQPNLPMGLHLRLGERFARAGDLKLAANIMNPYLQRDLKHEALPGAMITLAECYIDANRPRQALRFAELVSVQFPGTSESQRARRIMRQLKALAG